MLANTGAADWVLAYVDDHAEYIERMTYLDWRGTGAFSVDQDRLYRAGGRVQYDRAIQAHPAKMAELAERNTEAPKPYFPFAPAGPRRRRLRETRRRRSRCLTGPATPTT